MKRFVITGVVVGTLLLGVVLFRPSSPTGSGNSAQEGDRTARDGTVAAAEATTGFVQSRADPLPEMAGDFPKRAAAIEEMPPDTDRENAVRNLAQEWAAQSPVDAERWAAALEDPTERESALTHVCFETSVRNPRDAVEMAGWHRLEGGVVEAISGQWAGVDFEAATTWAAGLPAGDARDRILSRIVLSRSATAPEEAAQIVSESLSGEIQQEAAMAVLHQWLLEDPNAARAWVALFPDGPLKNRAEEEIHGLAASGDQQKVE